MVLMLAVASAWAGYIEDISAFKAEYNGIAWNNKTTPASEIATKAEKILADYPDMDKATKVPFLMNTGELMRRCLIGQPGCAIWYDRVLAATDAADLEDSLIRRRAMFLKGWCQAQPNTDSAKALALSTLESALAMPRKAGGWDSTDWDILYHIAHYSSQGAGTVEGAKILQARALVEGAQYAKGFPMNGMYAHILGYRYLAERDYVGGAAFVAAHPFVGKMGTNDFKLLAQIKQGVGDYVGAKAAFLDCFRTLKVGGNIDQATAALKVMDVENLFADAAEQVAFYNLLLRIVPATEGNAKFLGLVKSQIEAMKP
jgi:hypothetical protein